MNDVASPATAEVTSASASTSEWLGPPPSRVEIALLLFVGVMGILITGLMPLLFGALAQEERVSAAQLGRAATAELLTMGLVAGFAGARLPAERLRIVAPAMLLLLAVIDAVTPFASGEAVTLVRGAAGIPSGILIWITIGLITRSTHPERWAAIYLTAQTLAQFLLASILASAVVPHWGADGGFWTLSVLLVAAALAGFGLPSRLAPLEGAENIGGLPDARGWAALVVVFLYLAFTIAVWVYVEPLSRQAGHDPSIAGMAVAVSLACQVAGGIAATFLAGRLAWFRTVLVCSLLNAVLLAAFAALPSAPLYLIVSGAFGFLWLFMLPFLVPMVIEVDPSRRAALLMGGAQLLGGGLGPLFASWLVTDDDVLGAIYLGAAGLALAIAIVCALRATSASASAPEAA